MPVKQHPHGTVQRYWAGCRDEPCRAANTAYVAEKRRVKREAENPFPNSPQWMISRSLSRKRTSTFGSFGSARKSVYGIAKATPGIVGEPLVLSYWDESHGGWRVAWKIAEGTRVEDLPWRMSDIVETDACWWCGAEHPFMSRASRPVSIGLRLTRNFCHTEQRSCYEECKGRYFEVERNGGKK